MSFGFHYNFYNTRKNEFKLAKFIFSRYPELVKISRKTWEHIAELPPHLLNIFIANGLNPQHPPKHSYFKTSNDQILAFSRGQSGGLLGRGSCCKQVKCAINENGRIYALKTDSGRLNDDESKITSNIGLTKDKGTNGYLFKTKSRWEGLRYYRVQEYLGQSLTKNKNLTMDKKIQVAKKIFWELHKLHTGLSATDGTKYAHNDIKPDNIVLNEQNNPKLIDFGLSSIIEEQDNVAPYRGAQTYWPMSNDCDKGKTYTRLDKITAEEKDLFALKRSFYMHDLKMELHGTPNGFLQSEYESLPKELQNALNTADADEALQRKDTALYLTINFIALEFKKDPKVFLNYSKTQQIGLCRVIELTDQISLLANKIGFFESYKILGWIDSQRKKLFSANEEETSLMMHVQQAYYDYLMQEDAPEPGDLINKKILPLFKKMKEVALQGNYNLSESITERLSNLLELFINLLTSCFKTQKVECIEDEPVEETNKLIHTFFFQSEKNRGAKKPAEPLKDELYPERISEKSLT